MKLKIKLISVILIITMIVPMTLSSCGGYKSKYDAVMEYNGIKLTEEFYYYWLATYKRNILASYDDAEDTDEFWQSEYDEGITVEEYFTDVLNKRIMNFLIAQDLYKKNTLKLPSKNKNEIKKDIDEKIDFYGGRSELNKALSSLKLNIDALEQVYLWEAKHDYVYDYLFGEGGPLEITDSELISFYEENYYHIKYAVFYTTDIKKDEDGNYVYDENGELITTELSPEEMAKKLAKIAEFEEKMNSGKDFDTLIKDYSEFNTEKYPNGFFMSVNELDVWGIEIFNAVKEAKEGDICKVEEDEAIFFVKKLPLTDFASLSDTDLSQMTDIAVLATSKSYNDFYSELREDVKIHKDVMGKYKLSEIAANPYYSI